MDDLPDDFSFCTEIPVEPRLRKLADRLAIEENPENARGIRLRHPPEPELESLLDNGIPNPEDGIPTRDVPNLPMVGLALPVGSMWKEGRTLRIKFLPGQGSPQIRTKVQQYANQWTQFANIIFNWVADNEVAEIRVGIDNSRSSWSAIGTDCLTMPADQATLNLGSLQGPNTTEDSFRCDVLHEFGHALGCMHEHASPAGGIPWNKPKVYEYMMNSQGWTKAQVDINLFARVARNAAKFSSLDRKSIMFYQIPKELTLNGFFTDWNTQLSPGDKAFINQVYPTWKLSTNTFITTELFPWGQTPPQVSKREYFYDMFNEPPQLALGISRIDSDYRVDDRMKVYGDNITENCFDVHIDTWVNSRLYGCGCTWFASTPTRDSDFQVGKYNTLDDYTWGETPQTVTKRINFKRAYAAQPFVIVWLNHLDFPTGKNRRIKATATNADTKGFTINIETWADSQIYGAGISWIAYPSDKAGMASGTCGSTQPGQIFAGQAPFAPGTFKDPKNPPTVLIALSAMDVNPGADLRLAAYVDGVSNNGMTWHLDTWANTGVNMALAQWIAFAPSGPPPNGPENNDPEE